MATRAGGGSGARTQTVRAPREGCGCKPNSDGLCCATGRCPCRQKNAKCGPECSCGGMSGERAPMCTGHGAPAERQTVKKEGPNKGRQFFACPRKRDERCDFFAWCAPNAGCCANPLNAVDGVIDLDGPAGGVPDPPPARGGAGLC